MELPIVSLFELPIELWKEEILYCLDTDDIYNLAITLNIELDKHFYLNKLSKDGLGIPVEYLEYLNGYTYSYFLAYCLIKNTYDNISNMYKQNTNEPMSQADINIHIRFPFTFNNIFIM